MQDILDKAAKVQLVIFDVDGVLTDGGLYLGDDGQEYKTFHSKDGLGMKMLLSTGVEIGVITARSSRVVTLRMENLGVRHLYQGREDKLPAFVELQEKLGLDSSQIAYVGDDVVDLPILRRVGLSIAVHDSHREVLKVAHWKTDAPGGRGAAREVCELVMTAQGKLKSAMARYD